MENTKTEGKPSKVKKAVKATPKATPKASPEATVAGGNVAAARVFIPLYKLSILLGGETYVNTTPNIKESLLDLKPVKIVNKVVITVTHAGKKFEKVLTVMEARRIFTNRLSAEFFEKRVKLGLK